MLHQGRQQRLAQFAAWVGQHVQGDEKGEAQVYLDRLFQAFGQRGILEVGGHPEFRVRKAKEDGGGVAFADYVWKPIVLIEMKRRGENLAKHYRQAFEYWTLLAPNRPKWVVLCNFDEFWVYDFDSAQLDTPLDTVPLKELPERWGPLAFLFPTQERPSFGNDHESVTREAADRLAICFNKIVARGVERPLAQRFILQMLVALFAEDIGLLEKYFVTRLLEDCKSPADGYDLLGGLFTAMNTPGTSGGRYKGVDYFNGELFSEPARLELFSDELNLLRAASKSDWSKVRPEIFGTLFEHSLGHEERHAFGAHFTAPIDIMKIVGPTIVEPWRDRIETAKTKKQLIDLARRMHQYVVLDPACGSGNFLYLAYRELKRLEVRIYQRIGEVTSNGDKVQRGIGFVTASQFYGIDINPFAIELAKVTMMVARKLAIDELRVNEPALPLDNLDKNFVVGDALIDQAGHLVKWPRADVIIGNPPFLGAKRLKPERGADYVNDVRGAYPEVPGMADYCVYWLRKAHDHLSACTDADPLAGRAGLVGTQNIRNNQSRVGGLDHIVESGTIIEAVDNQPWSGEANVHVSIVNWAKTKDRKLLPRQRRLWSRVDRVPGERKHRPRGSGPAAKEFELASRECRHINSALSDRTDVTRAKDLYRNQDPPRSFNGQMLGHSGFLLTTDQRRDIVRRDAQSAKVIHPYLNGREVLSGSGRPTRFVLDFDQMDQLEAASYSGAFQWVRSHVLPDRERKAREGLGRDGDARPHHKAFLARWWQLSFARPELISLISKLPRFLCCSLVTKRPIFVFVASSIRPSNLLQVFCFADDYTFGILQSIVHWQWFVEKSSKLKSDFRYGEEVWNSFPWPQSPKVKQINAVAKAGRDVRRVRAEALTKIKGGLRAVYRTLELPGKNPLRDAHTALDAAVLAAYGFSGSDDLLSQLLSLNLDVARRIDAGESVTAPGIPPNYPEPERLISEDCIRPK